MLPATSQLMNITFTGALWGERRGQNCSTYKRLWDLNHGGVAIISTFFTHSINTPCLSNTQNVFQKYIPVFVCANMPWTVKSERNKMQKI